METLLELGGEYGLIGIIIAVLFYENFFLVKKVMAVIENNTKAMSELKAHCEAHTRKTEE